MSIAWTSSTCPENVNEGLGIVFLSLFSVFIFLDTILSGFSLRQTVLRSEKDMKTVDAVVVTPL